MKRIRKVDPVDRELLSGKYQDEVIQQYAETGINGAQRLAEQIYALILRPMGW